MNEIIEMDHVCAPASMNSDMAAEFMQLVKSFSATYFNMADIDSLVNLLLFKKEIRTLNAVIGFMNVNDGRSFNKYNKFINTRNNLITMQIKLENSLRVNVQSRREVRVNTKGFREDESRKERVGSRNAITDKDIWASAG